MRDRRTSLLGALVMAGMMLAGPIACTPSPAKGGSTETTSENTHDAAPSQAPDNASNLVAPADVATAPPPPKHAVPQDLPAENGSEAVAPFPQEVTDFMVARDSCDHFRGEEGYDADRRAFLEENIRELCTGTDAHLAALRTRYADDKDVTAALSGYEDRVEEPAED